MSKVNGNDGNNNDLMKGIQAYYEALRTKASGKEPNKPAEIKGENGTVPIVKQNGNKHTEMGDDLLTASFYPDVQFSKNINAIKADLAKLAKPEPGSLEELQKDLSTLTVASADRADKKAAYDAVQGDDWSSYLTRAYTYGGISSKTEEFLNNSEQMDKLNELAGLA